MKAPLSWELPDLRRAGMGVLTAACAFIRGPGCRYNCARREQPLKPARVNPAKLCESSFRYSSEAVLRIEEPCLPAALLRLGGVRVGGRIAHPRISPGVPALGINAA